MAGRFTLTEPDPAKVALALGIPPEQIPAGRYRPRYNLPPRARHWILVSEEGKRRLLPARWGLVNAWAKDARSNQTNARGETLASRPAFRVAFRKRRCVVPADGFFEWTGPKTDRRPVWFHRPDRGLLLIAGLFETWEPPEAAPETTFSLVTTRANAAVAPVKDRMVAILAPATVDRWLDPTADAGALTELLQPAPNDLLVATPVSTRVNSIRNDDPACLEPA